MLRTINLIAAVAVVVSAASAVQAGETNPRQRNKNYPDLTQTRVVDTPMVFEGRAAAATSGSLAENGQVAIDIVDKKLAYD